MTADTYEQKELQAQARHKQVIAVRIFATALVALAVTWFAWLGDDFLITLRTALNLTSGSGPVFNPGERVQASTHPLWLGLVTLLGWMTGQWVLTAFVVSIALATAAFGIVAARTQAISRIALGATAFLLCNSLVEYSTSGLENSLAYFLMALAVVATTNLRRRDSLTLGRAMSLAIPLGLLLVTRLDFALLVAPIGVVIAYRCRHQVRLLTVFAIVFVAPAVLWGLFSIIYYGDPLPATFYAKTNTEIPRLELLVSGIRYLGVSAQFDPIAVVIVLAGTVWAVTGASLIFRTWFVGVTIYLAYVVWIGGDFMAGRFLAVPCFVILAAAMLEPARAFQRVLLPDLRQQGQRAQLVVALLVLSVIGGMGLLGVGRSDVLTPELPEGARWAFWDRGGVADERGHYMAAGHGLWQYMEDLRPPGFAYVDPDSPPEGWIADLVQIQHSAAAWSVASEPERVQVRCGLLGEAGIYSGPATHWVDPCGLTDRFLADIPYKSQDFAWRSGHFDRPIPAGYLEAVLEGNPSLVEDEDLAQQLSLLWRSVRK